MEQEDSDIDKLFRQKLQDFEKQPSGSVWEHIQQNLNEQNKSSKNKNKTRYFLAIAASIVLLLVIGTLMYKLPLADDSAILSNSEIQKDTLQNKDLSKDKSENSKLAVPTTVKKKSNNQPLAIVIEKVLSVNLTTTDKKSEYILPDSSEITLNKHSQLRYNPDFSEKREVTILNGEAYFEVRKKKEPFIVNGNLSVTEVRGTSFMVRSHLDEYKDVIYVASGKVTVSHKNSASQKTFLLPDEKCVIKNKGPQALEKITEENYSSWKSEEIVFQNTEMKTVVETLEDYYAVRLQISNPEILSCRFTGRFEKSSFNEILQVLTATFNLSYNDREGVYTLSGKGCK